MKLRTGEVTSRKLHALQANGVMRSPWDDEGSRLSALEEEALAEAGDVGPLLASRATARASMTATGQTGSGSAVPQTSAAAARASSRTQVVATRRGPPIAQGAATAPPPLASQTAPARRSSSRETGNDLRGSHASTLRNVYFADSDSDSDMSDDSV